MKKIITLLLFLSFNIFSIAFAEEIEVSGEYRMNLTGYDINYVRNMQDSKMKKKAQNSNFEVIQTQQTKEAIRQVKTRNKLNKDLSQAAFDSDKITEAEELAKVDAIKEAIKIVKGEDVFIQYPETENKLNDIVKNASTYVLEEDYDASEMIANKNQYISRVHLVIDKAKFENLLTKKEIKSCYNAQINNRSILVFMDEFWATPSNLNQKTATKEVTTFKYDKDESEADKEAYKAASSTQAASSSKGAYANRYGSAGYAGKSGYSSKSGVSYGRSNEYKHKESLFYQHLTEYSPNFPKAQGMNATQRKFGATLKSCGIEYKNSDLVKSKYFKGKPITADVLRNSEQLAAFVDMIRKDPAAKADYIAIGFSYITENGKSTQSTGYDSNGNVELVVYSTTDASVLAETTEHAGAIGDTPDDARQRVAEKLGKKLGNVIAEQIKNSYINKKIEGEHYNIIFKGNFTLGERSLLYDALEQTQGITDLTEREANSTVVEYSIKYSGKKSLDMVIFGALTKCNMADKFQDTSKKEGTNIKFFKKGVACQ